MARFLPYWHETIAPTLRSRRRVLIAAHGNSLRALIKYLDDVSEQEINRLANLYPTVVKGARGLGFMLGVELQDRENIPGFSRVEKPPSLQLVQRLHEAGLLMIPSGGQVLRILPALNLPRAIAEEGIAILESVVKSVANG